MHKVREKLPSDLWAGMDKISHVAIYLQRRIISFMTVLKYLK